MTCYILASVSYVCTVDRLPASGYRPSARLYDMCFSHDNPCCILFLRHRTCVELFICAGDSLASSVTGFLKRSLPSRQYAAWTRLLLNGQTHFSVHYGLTLCVIQRFVRFSSGPSYLLVNHFPISRSHASIRIGISICQNGFLHT